MGKKTVKELIEMARNALDRASNKASGKVTLFAGIRPDQHEAIRTIALREKRSIADVTRDALDMFIKAKEKRPKKK